MSEIDGVIPVDKPEGPTSHDVVAQVRRALGTRRVGHTGTLDPFASGLLLVCVGPATRLSEHLTALRKSYLATARLGIETDTDDRMGAVRMESEAWRDLEPDAVRRALEDQAGERMQLPPRFSAKKVDGERMYAAARRGEEVERTPVRVRIHSIRVLEVRLPEVDFEVDCSSGTYIRAIARDAGEALGVGGHLTRLRRTSVGRFAVHGALTLDRLQDADAVGAALVRPADAVGHLARVVVDAEGERALGHGRAIPAPEDIPGGATVALLSAAGRLLALGECVAGRIQPRKVFA